MTETEKLQKEKLQKLFQAALLDANEEKVTLARAYPKTMLDTLAAQAPTPTASPQPAPEPEAIVQSSPAVAPVAPAKEFVQPMANAGLESAAAQELKVLLEEQNLRLKRRHRREAIGALVVFLALTVGGFGWFVHSPVRVQAAREAIKEIRSLGDIAGMVSKYQKAHDQIGTRSQGIDAATESMGVSSNQEGMKDVYLDAEMKEMMGSEGKTVGERNSVLQDELGKVETDGLNAAVVPDAEPAVDPSLSLDL